MLSVDEALEKIAPLAIPRGTVDLDSTQSLGYVLAEDVTSDVDSPPHDKSVVDGYAVRSADVVDGIAEFAVIEEIVAGNLPTKEVERGQATQIMTGAPIPAGADCVVMVEKTAPLDGNRIRIEASAVPGQNIVRRGASMNSGEIVLRAGHTVRGIEAGLLAEVGRSQVRVIAKPTVAILATGNELVPATETPAAGAIRNSNGPMLKALATRAGGTPLDLGIGRDEPNHLRALLQQGLECDVLVISGGVSMGVLDLVPGLLKELGVHEVFHKIRLKPGKPLWFGLFDNQPHQTLVFGLPGNPVSSLVCFEIFVRPTIARLAGRTDGDLQRVVARLSVDFKHRGDRPTYHPAQLTRVVDAWVMEPLRWHGSGDLRTLARANALAHFPSGDHEYSSGDLIESYLLDH